MIPVVVLHQVLNRLRRQGEEKPFMRIGRISIDTQYLFLRMHCRSSHGMFQHTLVVTLAYELADRQSRKADQTRRKIFGLLA